MTTEINRRRWVLPTQNEPSNARTMIQISTLGLVFVGLCIILGTGLRLFHLGTQNFWYDEMEAIRYASDLSLRDVHPPLYYTLLNLVLLLGQSEFLLRFPSVLVGILSIPLTYVVGIRLFPYSAALAATFLVSISPVLIWHAQDTRMYSQLVFACLLVVYTYLRAVEANQWKHWSFYLLAGVIAIYTHLYAFLLLGTLGLHFLVFHRAFIKRWFVTHALMALAYVPWLIIFISLPGKQIGTGHPVGLLGLLHNYYASINGYSLGPAIQELRSRDLGILTPYLPLIIPIALIALILFSVGMDYLRREGSEKFVLLAGWAFLPVIVAILIPYFRQSMTFNVRYVLFSVPALLLILGIGVSRIKPRYLGLVLLAIFAFYNTISLYNNAYDPTYAKEDVRSAAQYVASQVQPDDHILVVTVGRVFDWYFYPDNRIVSNVPSQDALDLVNQTAEGASSIWLVKSRPWQTDPDNELETLLDSRYALLGTVEFDGVSVYHYCLSNCVGNSTR